MTPTDLLSAIQAALDEAERLAQAAAEMAGETWHHRATLVSYDDIVDDDVKLVVRDGERLRVGEFDDDMVAHIARHDPAAVLRWVAATRMLLDEYKKAHAAYGQGRMEAAYLAGLSTAVQLTAHGLGIDPEGTRA